MARHLYTPLAHLLIAGTMIAALSIISPLALAEDETDAELVPEPWVHETHEYDIWGDVDGTPTDEFFINEKWSVEVRHGEVMTLIMARNITQGDMTSVDYTNNIHYYIGGKLYIAQFMMMELVFDIGGYELHTPLGTCSGFELEHTSTTYDGTVPTLDCSIVFRDIHVYQDAWLPAEYGASTVDLTLIHHIRGDWNNTRVKIEALLDFGDTSFYDQNDGNREFSTGEPFVTEVGYMMMLANPEDFRTTGPVIPTSCTNTTLEYNMTLDNGTPLTMSKLEMRDDFTAYNASGSSALVGYSSMQMQGGFAYATHGFPNLTYGDTLSMKSDPEITIYHDTVGEAYRPVGEYYTFIIMALGVAAVSVSTIAIIVWKRKRAFQSP
jgi:hypothetical protein